MFLCVWVGGWILKVTFLVDGLTFKKIVEWLYVALSSYRELWTVLPTLVNVLTQQPSFHSLRTRCAIYSVHVLQYLEVTVSISLSPRNKDNINIAQNRILIK